MCLVSTFGEKNVAVFEADMDSGIRPSRFTFDMPGKLPDNLMLKPTFWYAMLVEDNFLRYFLFKYNKSKHMSKKCKISFIMMHGSNGIFSQLRTSIQEEHIWVGKVKLKSWEKQRTVAEEPGSRSKGKMLTHQNISRTLWLFIFISSFQCCQNPLPSGGLGRSSWWK